MSYICLVELVQRNILKTKIDVTMELTPNFGIYREAQNKRLTKLALKLPDIST